MSSEANPEGNGPPAAPTSTGEAVRAVTDDVRRLVRAEVALARAEVGQQLQARGLAVGLLVTASLLGFFAFYWLTFAVYAGWGELVAGWIAALLTVLTLVVVAGVLVLVGVRILRSPMTPPERAIAAARSTGDLVRERVGR